MFLSVGEEFKTPQIPRENDTVLFFIFANEPAERRRSAGEAAENSAARRMAYAKKFSIEL